MRIAKLGELTKIKTGKLDANASVEGGRYPFFTCSIDPLRIDSYSYDCECVLLAGNGDLNVKYYEGRFDAYQRTYIIESEDRCSLDTRYLYYFLTQYVQQLRDSSIGAVIKYIKKGDLTEAVIPLPEITIQKRIICNLDLVIKLLDKEKKKEKYFDELVKSRFTEMFGSIKTNPKKWKMIPLEDVAPIYYLPIPSRGTVWQLNLDVIEPNSGLVSSKHYVNATEIKGSVGGFGQSQVLYSKLRPYLNKVVMPDEQGVCTTELLPLSPKKELLNRSYLTAVLRNSEFVSFANAHSNGAKMPRVDMNAFKAFEIPLPPLDYQEVFADFVIQVDKLKFDLGICLFILREETFRLSG